MQQTRIALLLVTAAALLAAPPAAQAARNPYTAAGVCGPGYKVIDRHRLFATNPYSGAPIKLAAVVLTYNAAKGMNCAVTLKRYRVGKVSGPRQASENLSVSLAARPLGPSTVDGDSGDFRFYAGPAYVPARNRCVQWGGSAVLLLPPNFHPRGTLNSAYRSRWEHCG